LFLREQIKDIIIFALHELNDIDEGAGNGTASQYLKRIPRNLKLTPSL
jgi:hypothetical protein